MTLTEQELKSITKEAISYVHQNFRVGEKSYQKCIQSYIAAATKYQEMVNGLLESIKKMAQATSNLIQDVRNKPNDTRYATHTKAALVALDEYLNAITNYNESLKG